MRVFVNGEEHEQAGNATIATLLASLDLVGRRIAVEVNEHIVPKGLYAQTLLHDNDRIEIVHAIGGG